MNRRHPGAQSYGLSTLGEPAGHQYLMVESETSTTISDVGPRPPTTTSTTLPPPPAIVDAPVMIGAGSVLLVATLLVLWRAFRSRGE
jgi:hypothetical protein